MANHVTYKDGLLAKNSEAYKLWEKKEFKALDKHLKELEVKNSELMKRYTPKEPKNELP